MGAFKYNLAQIFRLQTHRWAAKTSKFLLYSNVLEALQFLAFNSAQNACWTCVSNGSALASCAEGRRLALRKRMRNAFAEMRKRLAAGLESHPCECRPEADRRRKPSDARQANLNGVGRTGAKRCGGSAIVHEQPEIFLEASGRRSKEEASYRIRTRKRTMGAKAGAL